MKTLIFCLAGKIDFFVNNHNKKNKLTNLKKFYNIMLVEKHMTKDFEISTDSNCDLYANEIKDLGIYVGHLSYILDDGKNMTEHLDKFEKPEQYVEFFNEIRKGKIARTSILSLQAHIDLFTEMAEKGIKKVLHITQSYGLSPTLDNANKAIELVKEKYPDINYVAIESSTTTVGEGILVRIACEMRDAGKDRQEAIDWIESHKNKLQHIIMVDDLTCLKRGGRISGPKAAIATMLQIKPIIEFGKNGKLDVYRKEIGVKKAMKSMVEEFASHTVSKEYPWAVIIVHCGNQPRAEELANMVFEKTGVKPEIRIMGPIIGAHVGPGGVAIGFLSNEERPF